MRSIGYCRKLISNIRIIQNLNFRIIFYKVSKGIYSVQFISSHFHTYKSIIKQRYTKQNEYTCNNLQNKLQSGKNNSMYKNDLKEKLSKLVY